jgi:hypothetical protein
MPRGFPWSQKKSHKNSHLPSNTRARNRKTTHDIDRHLTAEKAESTKDVRADLTRQANEEKERKQQKRKERLLAEAEEKQKLDAQAKERADLTRQANEEKERKQQKRKERHLAEAEEKQKLDAQAKERAEIIECASATRTFWRCRPLQTVLEEVVAKINSAQFNRDGFVFVSPVSVTFVTSLGPSLLVKMMTLYHPQLKVRVVGGPLSMYTLPDIAGSKLIFNDSRTLLRLILVANITKKKTGYAYQAFIAPVLDDTMQRDADPEKVRSYRQFLDSVSSYPEGIEVMTKNSNYTTFKRSREIRQQELEQEMDRYTQKARLQNMIMRSKPKCDPLDMAAVAAPVIKPVAPVGRLNSKP